MNKIAILNVHNCWSNIKNVIKTNDLTAKNGHFCIVYITSCLEIGRQNTYNETITGKGEFTKGNIL